MKKRITKKEVEWAANRHYPPCLGTTIDFMENNMAVVTHSIDPKGDGEYEILLVIWKDDAGRFHVKDLTAQGDRPHYGKIEIKVISENKIMVEGEEVLLEGGMLV